VHLDDILEEAKGQLVVIDFFSNNCPPCERVAPLFEELAASPEFQAKVVFIKVNVEEHPMICNQYGVTGWPTFLFLKEGKVQTEIVGGKLAEATLYDWVKLLMPKDDATMTASSNDQDDQQQAEQDQDLNQEQGQDQEQEQGWEKEAE
jgi:thioredoxin 1